MRHKKRAAKKRRIRRTNRVYAPDSRYGLIEITVNSRAERQLLSLYWNSVQKFLDTGDDEDVAEFKGMVVHDGRTPVPLITNLDELERLGYAGVLSFESLYVAGS